MAIAADRKLDMAPGEGAADARLPAGGSIAGSTIHAGISNRTVAVYLALAVLLLVPGIALRLGADTSAPAIGATAFETLRAQLADIRFGSGLRFWLGVTGAGVMSLLLLYPVRKLLGPRRTVGSVGAWFHLHVIIGVLGPVLILYHCNFGLGGRNANVALWSMLAIAASGLVGQVVYRRVNADFYDDRAKAQEHLEAIRRLLVEVDGMHAAKARLMDDLEAFHARQLTPRPGLIAGLGSRVEIEKLRHQFLQEAEWIVGECARAKNWEHRRTKLLRRDVTERVKRYIGFARAGSGRSLREQVWAKWRLFHLPLFLMMTAAVVLHVAAVWDMDAPEALAPSAARASGPPAATAGAETKAAVQQVAVRTVRIEPRRRDAAEAKTDAARGAQPTASESRAAAGGDAKTIADLIAGAESGGDTAEEAKGTARAGARAKPAEPERGNARSTDAPPPIAKAPAAVPRAAVRAAPQPAPPVGAPDPVAKAAPTRKPAEAQAAEAERAAALPDQPPAIAVTAAGQSAPPRDDARALYAELERRSETPMMSLGVKGRSLRDQIALLKARMQTGEFAHSEAETGFALTGKHAKADCMSCHQKPLRETRVQTARQCIDCHRQDDVHRGRRPDCAKCHQPTRWIQILKGAGKRTRDD